MALNSTGIQKVRKVPKHQKQGYCEPIDPIFKPVKTKKKRKKKRRRNKSKGFATPGK